MALILVRFPVAVEDLAHQNRLPSVEELRPCSCPLCGQPARPPGSKLGIVGNGIYTRQVLGLLCEGGSLVIRVRRYLCRACARSISVLPDALLPWRWYAATTMLVALVLSLLQGKTAGEMRRRFGPAGETPGWKTLGRWQRQLLAPLWSWVAAQVAAATGRPAATRAERRDRLRRMAALHGTHARSPELEIEDAARALATGTAHTRTNGWLVRHAE